MVTVHFKDLHKGKEQKVAELAARYDAQVSKNGALTEQLVVDLMAQSNYAFKRSPKYVDYFFGSDGQLSWKKEGKSYSIHIDITGAAKKEVEWLDYSGHVASEPDFRYGGSNISFSIGLKRRHISGYVYRTPIYVIKIENKWLKRQKDYQAEFDFAVCALMLAHEQSGIGKRASMLLDK